MINWIGLFNTFENYFRNRKLNRIEKKREKDRIRHTYIRENVFESIKHLRRASYGDLLELYHIQDWDLLEVSLGDLVKEKKIDRGLSEDGVVYWIVDNEESSNREKQNP